MKYCSKISLILLILPFVHGLVPGRDAPFLNQRFSLKSVQHELRSQQSAVLSLRHEKGQKASVTKLHAATLEKTDESSRLSKAKYLLEQFSDDKNFKDDDFVDPAVEMVATAAAAAASRSSGTTVSAPVTTRKKTSMKSGMAQASAQKTGGTTPAAVVPDTFWRNGHLTGDRDGGADTNYVTRWARGVKVAEPLVKYDPVAAERLLFRQPAKWFVRNFQIALPIGWWAAGVVTDYLFDASTSFSPQQQVEQEQRRRQRAKQLTQAISSLGPAIIKGGQALASRPDLLPSEYLEELQKLQDDVPRFSNEKAFLTVEEELGMKFDDVFELVENEPVAAASIGQVYKARLKANGDLVAIKIQRPGCEEIIALDLYVLRWWSGIYNKIFQLLNRDIDVQSIIDDFGDLIYREIDYVAEAANAQRFNELYAGVRDVFVPKIYSELTTAKVLTMEWVDGCRLTDQSTLKVYGLDESQLVNTLVQCSLRQILENGLFHADPHGGNLLACPDGRLCYLDFGMMSYATATQRNGFLLAVVHIVNRDWGELVRLYGKLGFIPEGTDLKPIEIALENALPDVLNAEISELNIKNIFNKLGDIMYTFPFSLPPFYIAIIRCLGVLEGLAIQVDPKARIVSEAYPYVASRVLTDPQPELQEAFQRLVFTNDGQLRWDRLEGLLEEAKDSSGYDVSAALNVLTNYLISDDGDKILRDLSIRIVDAADSLGEETVKYVIKASQALAINDEVAAVRAIRELQEVFRAATSDEGLSGVRKKVGEDLRGVLPELSPAMKQFARILSLLGAQNAETDPAKFVPIIRKLSQELRIQRTANDIIARLGERVISRGLRSLFGLPPPTFGTSSDTTTVTEDLN